MSGGADRDRTDDLVIANDALSQLSYGPLPNLSRTAFGAVKTRPTFAFMELRIETVADYPRPPALEAVPQLLRGEIAGDVLFATNKGLRVLETHHAPTYYIPLDAFATGALHASNRRSFCEWKGNASYFDLVFAGRTVRAAAWTYPDPTPRFAALKDHVAIYAHALDTVWVGDHNVTPQPGDFYGGWVTSNLRGIVKGGPGTEGW